MHSYWFIKQNFVYRIILYCVGIGIFFRSRGKNLWIEIFKCRHEYYICARSIFDRVPYCKLRLIFLAQGCLTRVCLAHKASCVFLLLQVNSDLFILLQKSMLFFDMRTSFETLYTSLLGVADCYLCCRPRVAGCRIYMVSL